MSLQRSLIPHDHRPILDRLPSRIRFATGTGARGVDRNGRTLERDGNSKIKRPAEAGRLFLISCRRACRLGRDSVSAGRVFDLGFDPAGRASDLDFDSADLVYRWASCFLSKLEN